MEDATGQNVHSTTHVTDRRSASICIRAQQRLSPREALQPQEDSRHQLSAKSSAAKQQETFKTIYATHEKLHQACLDGLSSLTQGMTLPAELRGRRQAYWSSLLQ